MSVTLLHKKSTVPGKVPTTSDLTVGELAVNAADGLVYTKLSGDGSIVKIGAASDTAVKLKTARLINGIPFDGTTDITIGGGGGTDIKTIIAGAAGITTYMFPGGASYNASGNVTGTLKITLPVSWTNTMLRIKLKGFFYTTGGQTNAFELNLAGYNYGTTPAWVNCSAQSIGPTPFATPVRFAHDGTKCCILLGTTATVLAYPKVIVEEVMATYGAADTGWDSGWTISQVTSETGITVTKSVVIGAGSTSECLSWNNYTDHKVFDASATLSPTGAAISSNSDPDVDWTAGYPTLMGWNGTSTYGVRVARAKNAEVLVGSTINNAARISVLNGSAAQGVNMGSLLVSNAYADAPLVPANGAYIKGVVTLGGLNSSMSTATGSSLQIQNVSGTASSDSALAMMTFLCGGLYGIKMGLRPDGYFGIGGWSRAAWSWYTDPNGNMVAAGNVTAYSDRRLKKNLKKIKAPTEKVLQLTGYTFTRKDTGEHQTGLIAQDVQKVLPEAVSVGQDGDTLGVSYGNLAGLFVETFKEMNKRLEKLEEDNRALKAELKAIKKVH